MNPATYLANNGGLVNNILVPAADRFVTRCLATHPVEAR